MSNEAQILLQSGVEHQKNGRLQEAESAYRQALLHSRSDADVLNNLGLVLLEKGELTEARLLLHKALEIRPDFTNARYNLGRVLMEAGQFSEAIAVLDNILSIEPDDADTCVLMGICLERLNRFEEAQEYFEDASDFADKYLLARQVRFDKAFFQHLEVQQGNQTAFKIATHVERNGNPEYIALIASDSKYFEKYGFAFVNSFMCHSLADNAMLHVHLIDASEETLTRVTSCLQGYEGLFAITTETSPKNLNEQEAAVFYSCSRFIHLDSLLSQYARPIIVLDIDAIVEGSLQPLITATAKDDVGLNQRIPRRAPWMDIKAGFSIALPTQKSIQYWQTVSSYICRHFQIGATYWQLDQIALYCSLILLRRFSTSPSVKWLRDEESPVWQMGHRFEEKLQDPRFLRFSERR